MRYSRIGLTVVFLSYALAALTCSAQETSTAKLPKNDLIVPNVNGIFVSSLPNAPFSGTVTIISQQRLSDGSVNVLKTINHIARDSQGRTYNERRRFVASAFEDVPPILSSSIFDAVTGQYTHLDPYTLVARQTTTKTPPIGANTTPITNVGASSPSIKNEDLGSQIFENLLLKGIRQTQEGGVTDEFWYSPDLSVYVIHKHDDPQWTQTFTLTQIDRSEPEPSRFIVPKNYKVVDGTSNLAQSGAYRVGGGVTPPKVIHSVNPQYTEQARQAKLNGICLVSLIVDSNGVPQNVRVVRPLGLGLDEKAVEAVKQYRFKPAVYNGNSVPVEVNIEVQFKIY